MMKKIMRQGYRKIGRKNFSRSPTTPFERKLASKLERHHSVPGLGAELMFLHHVYICSFFTSVFLEKPKKASVIGAPLSWGQPLPGTDQGPKLLRQKGLIPCLECLHWMVHRDVDIEFDTPVGTNPESTIPHLRNSFCVGSGLEKIYNESVQDLRAGAFSLVLGGDHSIGLATVAAALSARPDVGIIWVDAHGDLNTPKESESGNIHGMPLAFLTGLVKPEESREVYGELYPGFEWFRDLNIRLNPQQLVYVGLRDLDSFERSLIRHMGIKAYTMQHVDRFGIGGVMEKTLKHLEGRPLHMSYDIDAVDPEIAPSTGTVVRGGLNFREAHYVAEAAGDSGRLCSMDLVEVNPTLKPGKEAELTCHLGMAIIASAMGSRIL
eukprot:snap_masked-scaffold_3-processed-gene-16.44-mRNA-1 protein AED:0.05 eAED:0.05 QI:105/1/1/1/0.25/0.2/5/170/379